MPAMEAGDLANLLRFAPPLPPRAPRGSTSRAISSTGGHDAGPPAAWSAAPPLPSAMARMATARLQARMASVTSVPTPQAIYQAVPPPVLWQMSTTPLFQRQIQSLSSIEHPPNVDGTGAETETRFSRDSLRLQQAYADLSSTLRSQHDSAMQPLSSTLASAAGSDGAVPFPTEHAPSAAASDQPSSNVLELHPRPVLELDQPQDLTVSTTDAPDAEPVPSTASVSASHAFSMTAQLETTSLMSPSLSTLPSTPTRSRFREHTDVGEAWQGSEPSTPTGRLRFFGRGERNLSQPSIFSLSDSRQSTEVGGGNDTPPSTPRSPFRMLRGARPGQSVSTSSLLTTANSSPLRSSHTTPERKRRQFKLSGGRDILRWMGGWHSSAHLPQATTEGEPEAGDGSTSTRRRRASLSSLSTLLHLSRSRRVDEDASLPQTPRSPLNTVNGTEAGSSSAPPSAAPVTKSRFQGWPFQQHDDPFASTTPVVVRPAKSKQRDIATVGANASRKVGEEARNNDGDISPTSPGSPAGVSSVGKGVVKRFNITTTGPPIRPPVRGSSRVNTLDEDLKARGNRLSWLPQLSWPVTISKEVAALAPAQASDGEVATGSPLRKPRAQRTVSDEEGIWLAATTRVKERVLPPLPHAVPGADDAVQPPQDADKPAASNSSTSTSQKESTSVPPSLRGMKQMCVRGVQSVSSLRSRYKLESRSPKSHDHSTPPPSSWRHQYAMTEMARQAPVTTPSRTSRLSSTSHFTSPDSETVAQILSQSLTSLPTPMPSSEIEREDEAHDAEDEHSNEESTRRWSLLQTASPLCSPRHHRQGDATNKDVPDRESSKNSEHQAEGDGGSNEAQGSSRARMGGKRVSVQSSSTTTSPPPAGHGPHKLAVFNVATSAAALLWKTPLVPNSGDGAPTQGRAPPLHTASTGFGHGAGGFTLDLEFESPSLNVLDAFDQILAAARAEMDNPVSQRNHEGLESGSVKGSEADVGSALTCEPTTPTTAPTGSEEGSGSAPSTIHATDGHVSPAATPSSSQALVHAQTSWPVPPDGPLPSLPVAESANENEAGQQGEAADEEA